MNVYIELQQNRYRWFLIVFAIVFFPSIFYWAGLLETFVKEGGVVFWVLVLYYLIAVCIVILISLHRVELQIDKHEIRYRLKPWMKWQVIIWSDIEKAYVREYALVGEYPKGLGGTRQGPNGWVYSMYGTWGLQLKKKSGLGILIGTQRPDELRAFLEQLQKQTV